MSHSHKIEKLKDQSDFDSNGTGYFVVQNISGRNLTLGSDAILLYPGDKAFSCDDNPKVLSAIKSYKLEIVEIASAKPKTKKSKTEEQKEETLTTVADSNEQDSVQLDLPDNSETLKSDEL